MTQELLTVFLANSKTNSSLQEQLKAAVNGNAVDAIDKDTGFRLSADDFAKA